MGNITRVGKDIKEGEIIEFNQQSEPTYLYTNGKLVEITPQEFNILVSTEKSQRGWELDCFRGGFGRYFEDKNTADV